MYALTFVYKVARLDLRRNNITAHTEKSHSKWAKSNEKIFMNLPRKEGQNFRARGQTKKLDSCWGRAMGCHHNL